MVEMTTYQISIFVFHRTFCIEKQCAKIRPYGNVHLSHKLEKLLAV